MEEFIQIYLELTGLFFGISPSDMPVIIELFLNSKGGKLCRGGLLLLKNKVITVAF
jgi:hypothetical protein